MMSNDKGIPKKIFSKSIAGGTITATLALHSIMGQKPYFSITGSITPNGSFGCIHEEIAKHFPELAQWIPLHLSDEDGVPMHSVENGLYHAGFYDEPAKPQVLADHLRISLEEAKKLCYNASTIFIKTKVEQQDTFKAFVEAQKTRWKGEAKCFANFLTGV